MYGKIVNFWEAFQAHLFALSEQGIEFLERTFLFSSDQIPVVLLIAILLVCLGAFAVAWQHHSRARPWLIALSFTTIPVAVFVVLMSLESIRGNPDDKCSMYEGGQLNLTLLGVIRALKNPDDVFGGDSILLTARSARWGVDPHLCRISADTEAGKVLLDTFFPKTKLGKREETFQSFGEGEISFKFGGPQERPNVTFKPTAKPDKKLAPPETPQRF